MIRQLIRSYIDARVSLQYDQAVRILQEGLENIFLAYFESKGTRIQIYSSINDLLEKKKDLLPASFHDFMPSLHALMLALKTMDFVNLDGRPEGNAALRSQQAESFLKDHETLIAPLLKRLEESPEMKTLRSPGWLRD